MFFDGQSRRSEHIYKGGDVYFFKSPILQFEGLKIDLFGKNLMKCITYIQDSSKIYAFLTYNI